MGTGIVANNRPVQFPVSATTSGLRRTHCCRAQRRMGRAMDPRAGPRRATPHKGMAQLLGRPADRIDDRSANCCFVGLDRPYPALNVNWCLLDCWHLG